MILRDLLKMNSINDGTRSLTESIVIPEVAQALKDWSVATNTNSVLIGGLATSFYAKPRSTTDIDLLFMSVSDIPSVIEGFKKIRNNAFHHKRTHVEVELITPSSINVPQEIAIKVLKTSVLINGVRVASPSGIVVLKLHRLKRYDSGDIVALIETGKVDLTGWRLTNVQLDAFEKIKQSM